MDIVQGTPSEATDDGALARAIVQLLGTAYSAPDGSNNAADALADAGALVDARSVLLCALDEAFLDTSWDLLSEHEAEYGLPVRPDLAPADRQARLVAKARAARGAQPQRILLAVRAIDPTATLVEFGAGDVPREADFGTTWGASRGVYCFVVVVAAAVYADPTKLATLAAIVQQMKQGQTSGVVALSGACRFDDPTTPFDQSTFGV